MLVEQRGGGDKVAPLSHRWATGEEVGPPPAIVLKYLFFQAGGMTGAARGGGHQTLPLGGASAGSTTRRGFDCTIFLIKILPLSTVSHNANI